MFSGVAHCLRFVMQPETSPDRVAIPVGALLETPDVEYASLTIGLRGICHRCANEP